ncbi:hypothetical protein AB7351_20330, partial [Providencia rettgeri]
RCHRQNMKTSIINGSEVSRLSVAIHYQLINQFKKEGLSIILVSSEMPEVIGMSDRILVMHEGHISGEFSAKDATQEALMAAAVGKNYGSVQELSV